MKKKLLKNKMYGIIWEVFHVLDKGQDECYFVTLET